MVRPLGGRKPVAIMTDSDAGGIGIYNILRFGSHKSVVYRYGSLACPGAIHIGLIPEDRTSYTLTGRPGQLTQLDRTKLVNMLKRPYIQAHPIRETIQSMPFCLPPHRG